MRIGGLAGNDTNLGTIKQSIIPYQSRRVLSLSVSKT